MSGREAPVILPAAGGFSSLGARRLHSGEVPVILLTAGGSLIL